MMLYEVIKEKLREDTCGGETQKNHHIRRQRNFELQQMDEDQDDMEESILQPKAFRGRRWSTSKIYYEGQKDIATMRRT